MKNIMFLLVVCPLLATASFGQVTNSTLTGTVADSTGAVLPGVTVSATNTATGVASTNVTNEAGAYTLQGLISGTYNVSSELPGFQRQTYSNVELGNGVTVRLNFSLPVATQAQSVEVTIAADTALSTLNPTIAHVLTERRIRESTVVGNNVLDMLNALGVDNLVPTSANPSAANAFGREATTLAGVSAAFTPVLRDGVMVQDTRWPTGINSATVINPDLVGEIRMVVAPVDAEIGRGNGAVQITTRSGTNQFHGAGVWSIQNSALNANSWGANRQGLPINYFNTNQVTGSIGGPIVKNKTFFYGLFDRMMNRQRANTYSTVLTPCAANGVFRYFDGWNNGAVGSIVASTGNPVRPVVDLAGNPVTPTANPNGSPYTGQLRHVSVYGPVTFPASGPNADCSNGTVAGSWDAFRTRQDPTGLISRTLALMPAPNDFTNANSAPGFTADGLNIASYRYVRRFRGLDNLFSVGEASGDRYQYNGRIDHNFNGQNKVQFNFSYERVSSDDVVAALPNTWNNENYHRPMVLNGNWVSTVSASIVNEARFGYRKTGTNVVAPWDREDNKETIDKYLPARVGGFRILPNIWAPIGLCSPISGVRPPGNCAGGAITTTATDETPLWTYGDTLSWSKGKHTYKFGGELRYASSTTVNAAAGSNFFGNSRAPVVLGGGAAPNAPLAVAGTTAIANSNPAMSGLGNTDAARARNLLNFLAGSLSGINNQYFLTDPKSTTFADGRNQDFVTNTVNQREFSFFFKDDYKVGKNLTLNLGVRYEYYGVPYSPFGLAVSPTNGSGAAFGYSGTDFTAWMRPGPRRGEDLIFNFVGPNSPNEGRSVFNKDRNNFGPAAGFAWSPSFLGADKTTIRGGYQVTFQGGSRFSPLEVPLTYPPGRIYDATYSGDANIRYLDLTTVSAAGVLPAPLPPGVAPMTPISLTDRSQSVSIIDKNYVSPYVQNLTLSITHGLRNNLTVDFRYIGTLVRKNYSTINLNVPNFLYNGLTEEFNKVLTGGESTVLDAMLNGVNICATGCPAGQQFGPIGGVNASGVRQTAAQQMRVNSTFGQNLANGNFAAVATSLATLNYVQVGCPAAGAAGNCGFPAINPSVVRGSALRVNGTPENLILTNPQFATVNYLANMGSSNYHSFQSEVTLRPTHGLSGTANYTLSRNLGLPLANAGFTNPVERHQNYSIVNNNHDQLFRVLGNVELPFGPGRLVLGNSSGFLARAVEGWRIGLVYNLSTGNWMSFTAQNMQYSNGVPDVANADLYAELIGDAGVKWGIPTSNNWTEGAYFDPAKWTKVTDPLCGTVSSQITQGAVLCNLQAVAKIVPANTPGAVITARNAAGNPTQYGLIVLQNPKPGKIGNLGNNVIKGPALWGFNTNLQKSFKIGESKSLQFRADAFNVTNHPQPGNPNLSINPNLANGVPIPFGQITAKAGGRSLQAQLRFQF